MKTKIVIYNDGVCTASGSMLHLERQAADDKPIKTVWLDIEFPPYTRAGMEQAWQEKLCRICRQAAERAGVL